MSILKFSNMNEFVNNYSTPNLEYRVNIENLHVSQHQRHMLIYNIDVLECSINNYTITQC